jgi:hypothetical protein
VFQQLSQRELATHVKVLGWIVFVTGVMGVVGSACMFVVMTTLAFAEGDAEARQIVPMIALGFSTFLGLLSCISLVAGYGLLKRKSWARVLGLVDGFLGLMWFPIGTLAGLYAFWVLLQAEAEPYFRPAVETAGPPPELVGGPS